MFDDEVTFSRPSGASSSGAGDWSQLPGRAGAPAAVVTAMCSVQDNLSSTDRDRMGHEDIDADGRIFVEDEDDFALIQRGDVAATELGNAVVEGRRRLDQTLFVRFER